MGEHTITNIMKVSLAGSSPKESEKKVYESQCKKNNSEQAEESKDYKFRIYRQYVTGHRGINFLNDYDEADEEERDDSCCRPNEIMKTPTLRKSKYYITVLANSDIRTTVAPLTHRWQRRKKTNCLLHFRVLNLKNLSMNPAMTGSQEQTMINSR